MKKRRIREAAIEVLKRKGKPLSTKEIYNLIILHDFCRFNAANPEKNVKDEIRRHCMSVEFPTGKLDKYFQILINGRTLIDFISDKKFGFDSGIIPVFINAFDNAITNDTL